MDQKDWLSIVTEEYKTARQESFEAGNNAQSILKFGVATIGIVISTGLNLWEKKPIPDFVFLIFNPIFCYLILTIWIGEFARRIRVGHFITQEIEQKVNRQFQNFPSAITFETWIRIPDKQGKARLFKWNRYATITLFLITALCSIAVGNYSIVETISLYNLFIIDGLELIVFLGVVIFNYSVGKKLN